MIFTAPDAATSAEGTDAVSCVELTNVVARAVEPHITLAPETNANPLTVSVKEALCAATAPGLTDATAGTGFVTVNATDAAEAVPSGCRAEIDAGPAVARFAAGTAALRRFEPMNVVARGLPFQSTDAPETKPLPYTVSERAAEPTVAVVWLSDAIVGTGSLTVSARELLTGPVEPFFTVTA